MTASDGSTWSRSRAVLIGSGSGMTNTDIARRNEHRKVVGYSGFFEFESLSIRRAVGNYCERKARFQITQNRF